MLIRRRSLFVGAGAAVLVGAAVALVSSRLDQPRSTRPYSVPSEERALPNDASSNVLDRFHLGDASSPARAWSRRYRDADDYFAFAQDAAKAAVDGDARAQYLLSQALLECQLQVARVSRVGKDNANEGMEAYLLSHPTISEQERAKIRSEIERCDGFFRGSPLDGLSLSQEARSSKYWFEKAVESGDPLAVMDRTMKLTAADLDDDESKTVFREALQKDVRAAIASREPAALAKVGFLYSSPTLARDNANGFAWVVAACQAGYDCSTANPEIGGRGCVSSGTCETALTMPQIYERDLGSVKFAAIYAQAQDILYKVNAGDWDGLQQYLELRM